MAAKTSKGAKKSVVRSLTGKKIKPKHAAPSVRTKTTKAETKPKTKQTKTAVVKQKPSSTKLKAAGSTKRTSNPQSAKPQTSANKPQSPFAANFTAIIGILMRDKRLQNMRLKDVATLIVPPLAAGQWRIARAQMKQTKGKDAGRIVVIPAGVVLWAMVSTLVDLRLSKDPTKPLALTEDEWTSGDIPWLVMIAGEKNALAPVLSNLYRTVFKDKIIRSRMIDAEGKATIAMRKV